MSTRDKEAVKLKGIKKWWKQTTCKHDHKVIGKDVKVFLGVARLRCNKCNKFDWDL